MKIEVAVNVHSEHLFDRMTAVKQAVEMIGKPSLSSLQYCDLMKFRNLNQEGADEKLLTVCGSERNTQKRILGHQHPLSTSHLFQPFSLSTNTHYSPALSKSSHRWVSELEGGQKHIYSTCPFPLLLAFPAGSTDILDWLPLQWDFIHTVLCFLGDVVGILQCEPCMQIPSVNLLHSSQRCDGRTNQM